MMRLLGAKLAFGLALLCTPAQAVQIEIAPLPDIGNPYLLVAGNVYADSRLFPAGSGAFNLTYQFTFAPPPDLNGLFSADLNFVGKTFGIDNFTWDFNGPLGDIVDGVGEILDAPFSLVGAPGGIYTLTVTGTPKSNGGSYLVSLDVQAVPVPGAALLFLSGLAGLGGLALRRRRHQVAAA